MIRRYIRKYIHEAVLFDGNNHDEIVQWTNGAFKIIEEDKGSKVLIRKDDGMIVRIGEYVLHSSLDKEYWIFTQDTMDEFFTESL